MVVVFAKAFVLLALFFVIVGSLTAFTFNLLVSPVFTLPLISPIQALGIVAFSALFVSTVLLFVPASIRSK